MINKEKAIEIVKEKLKQNNFRYHGEPSKSIELGENVDKTYDMGKEVGYIWGLMESFDISKSDLE